MKTSSLRNQFMGWPGSRLILPGLVSEAVNQHDIILDRVTFAARCVTRKRSSRYTSPGSVEPHAMRCSEAGKPVIKFNHCQKFIYSFSVPERCPLCRQEVGSRKLEEAPISISNPFTNGHQEKCSFLLRPTQGTFLRDYDGRSDLHVGITNTNGVVYNYNIQGVHRDEAGWEQSISIPLLQPNMYGLMDQWDKYLEEFSNSGAWLPHRYEEDHHNCYNYTLTFINCILSTEGREQLDKNNFTEKYVLPRTKKASKYITLYRAIEEHGFYMTDQPQQEASPP